MKGLNILAAELICCGMILQVDVYPIQRLFSYQYSSKMSFFCYRKLNKIFNFQPCHDCLAVRATNDVTSAVAEEGCVHYITDDGLIKLV